MSNGWSSDDETPTSILEDSNDSGAHMIVARNADNVVHRGWTFALLVELS